MIIRNPSSALGIAQAPVLEISSATQVRQQKRTRASRHFVSMSSISAYVGVFLLVMSLVVVSYHAPQKQNSLASANIATATTSAGTSQSAVDSLMATSIGATIAESTDLPVANNITNLAQSLAIENTLAHTDTNIISKPQIVQPTSDSRTPKTYTTVAGDNVATIAQRYGVSSQTIKWTNKLTSDALEPGKTLTIPPIDGLVYTVKAGDTIDSIVARYKADRSRLVAFNDLELSAPVVGSQIIIPGGDLPLEEQPGYVAPRRTTTTTAYTSTYSGGYSSRWGGGTSGGNRYAWGNCTWYAYERRAQLGSPVGGMWGNANTWAYSAAASGYQVDGNPAPGAVMANGGGYGHVAIVESVNPGVSITISEMNGYRFGGGFARIGNGEVSWGEAVSGMYRYIH